MNPTTKQFLKAGWRLGLGGLRLTGLPNSAVPRSASQGASAAPTAPCGELLQPEHPAAPSPRARRLPTQRAAPALAAMLWGGEGGGGAARRGRSRAAQQVAAAAAARLCGAGGQGGGRRRCQRGGAGSGAEVARGGR